MRVQLRDYAIAPGAMEEWLRVWRLKVTPLRGRFGFQVLGAWADAAGDRFVWIVGHDGAGMTWDEAEAAYFASPERKAMDADIHRLIVASRSSFFETVHT